MQENDTVLISHTCNRHCLPMLKSICYYNGASRTLAVAVVLAQFFALFAKTLAPSGKKQHQQVGTVGTLLQLWNDVTCSTFPRYFRLKFQQISLKLEEHDFVKLLNMTWVASVLWLNIYREFSKKIENFSKKLKEHDLGDICSVVLLLNTDTDSQRN